MRKIFISNDYYLRNNIITNIINIIIMNIVWEIYNLHIYFIYIVRSSKYLNNISIKINEINN